MILVALLLGRPGEDGAAGRRGRRVLGEGCTVQGGGERHGSQGQSDRVHGALPLYL